MAHGTEVVHLVWVGRLDCADERCRIGQIAFDEVELRELANECRRLRITLTPDQAEHFVATGKKKFGEMTAVLSCDPGDKCRSPAAPHE